MPDLNWHDIIELGVRGRGWHVDARPYVRLPAHAEAEATEAVWRLSRQSTGLYVDFISDSGTFHARTRLHQRPGESQGYLKYLDLYCRDGDGAWRWAGVSRNGFLPSGETPLIEDLPTAERQWRLYLPLTYEVERIELGVPQGARLEPAPEDARPPVVLYGTSIVHGCGHLSRPGMVWPSIVGRGLDYSVINLGFSGSAQCEPPLGEILAELDPAVFVVDPLANMSLELVERNMEPFLRHLLARRPQTPILMVEDRTHTHAWLLPNYAPTQQAKQAAFRAIADKLRDEGYAIHYLPGADLIGHDSEGTTDGSHPSDLGAMRYAEVVTPTLLDFLKPGDNRALHA